MKTGLVANDSVDQGADAIKAAFDDAKSRGEKFVVVDAISDRHLMSIGEAIADHKLITGGSGIALGLPENYARQGLLKKSDATKPMQAKAGRSLILSGSCSEATRGQVAKAVLAGMPALRVDALDLAAGKTSPEELVTFATEQEGDSPVLIYSSDTPDVVATVQEQLGREAAGSIVENALSETAQTLVKQGFTRIIVAGGETSGAVVNGLGVNAIEIGPEIDPGVPWTRSLDDDGLVLALKSGNFGAEDFFMKAWDKLA